MAELYRLRFYGDDGTTVDAEYTTDPAHARPFLIVPDYFAEQEIDFAAGRATIGAIVVEIVDVPVTPADQSTGHFTSKLANAGGLSARMFRRAHLELFADGAYRNVINGVVDKIALHESMASYVVTLKDQRENERRTRVFTRATTSSISPRGVIDGFGLNAVSGEWLAPPVKNTPHLGVAKTYASGGETAHRFEFSAPFEDKRYWPTADQILTEKMLAAMFSRDEETRHNRLRILWRGLGGGAWNVVENPLVPPPSLIDNPTVHNAVGRGRWKTAEGATLDVAWMREFSWKAESGHTALPADGTAVHVIFGYAGPASEEYPFHYEGTIGGLAAGMMDGDWSEGDAPDTQYDAVAVAAMTEPTLLRMTEPLDDEDGMWKWAEPNLYAAYGRAPASDADGLISPIAYALPAAGAVLEELDDSNCEPMAGWSHTGQDAINVVAIEYPRYYRVPAESDPTMERSSGDGLAVVNVRVERRNPDAIVAIGGERPLTIKAATLGAIGGVDGEPVNGDIANEQGSQFAHLRASEAMDRFVMGGQYVPARVMRSAVGELRAGQFVIAACSWWPAYESGTRGPDRIAQLMRVKVIDSQWYEVLGIDCGPDGAAVGNPTISVGALKPDGSIPVTVATVAAGSQARIDYAISTLEPAATSPLWRFAGRKGVPLIVMIPPSPSGSTVWIRARGEKEGARPGAWIAAVSVAIAAAPRFLEFHLLPTTGGQLKAVWKKNAATNGVRLYYQSHDDTTVPAPVLFVDVDADDLEYTFAEATTDANDLFTVEPVAYPGWSGAAVTGTAGQRLSRTVAGTAIGDESPMAPVLEAGPTIDENQGTAIATFGVLIRDPFDVRTRLLSKKRIGGEEWPASWSVVSAGPLKDIEYTLTVAMVEGHTSQIMFGVEYALPDSDPGDLPIFTLTSPAFDMGLIANVTSASIDFATDGEAIITAIADYDTVDDGIEDSIIFTVDEDADPPDPTLVAHDGVIIGRAGTAGSGVIIAIGSEARVKLAAISRDAVLGPVFGPVKKLNPAGGGGNQIITNFLVWRANTTVTDPVNMKVTYVVAGDTGWYIDLEEYDVYAETTRTVLNDDTDLDRSQYAFTAGYLQAAKNAGDLSVDMIYTLIVYDDGDVERARANYSVTLTDVDEPL